MSGRAAAVELGLKGGAAVPHQLSVKAFPLNHWAHAAGA